MAHTDEYLDCVNNWWSGFVGKETCEAGYLVCKGEECDRYTPEKKQKKQTNADKYFCNATDEELAKIIVCAKYFDRLCEIVLAGENPGFCDDDCNECALNWLKQEVQDER